MSDWSSVGSPPIRTSRHSTPDVPIESIDNVQNQLTVPSTRETRPTSLSTEVVAQRDNVETNEETVTIIPPAPIRSARSSLHMDDVVTGNVTRRLSTQDVLSGSSHVRSHDLNIEGKSSIHPVDSGITSGIRQIVLDDRGNGPSYQHEGIHPPRTSTANKRDSSDSSDSDRFHRERGYANERGRPPERERYPSRDRRPPRRRGIPSNGRPPDGSDREEPSDRGGLPDRNGPPDDGGPLMMEDCLMMVDYLVEMEDPKTSQ